MLHFQSSQQPCDNDNNDNHYHNNPLYHGGKSGPKRLKVILLKITKPGFEIRKCLTPSLQESRGNYNSGSVQRSNLKHDIEILTDYWVKGMRGALGHEEGATEGERNTLHSRWARRKH